MIIFPNAKINLGLNITSKREDGYHNLETVFYPVDICDALEINFDETGNQKDDELIIHGIRVEGTLEENLVMKALKLMREEFEFPSVKLHLLKKIPTGAGMGGGSADAAFTLKLLDKILKLDLTQEKLASLAVQLGADCPFFVYNTPMYAEGIGEKLSSVDVCLHDYCIYVVKPNISISTKEAFEGITPQRSKYDLREIIKKPVEEWKNFLKNDFEKSLFPKYPLLKEIKEKLYCLGATYSSMTGSGAAIYALSKTPLQNLKNEFHDCFFWQNKI